MDDQGIPVTTAALRGDSWPVPGRWLGISDGRLVWDWSGWNRTPTFTGVGRNMLEWFLTLGDAPDAEILDYAQTWGMLDTCQHHLPALPEDHPTNIGLPYCMGLVNIRTLLVRDDCQLSRPLVEGGKWERWEEIATWRYWAGQARAILNLGLRLAAGRVVDPVDVAQLYERAPWAEESLIRDEAEHLPHLKELRVQRIASAATLSVLELRGFVEDGLAFWTEMSRAHLRLVWPRRGPDVYMTGGLFGALGNAIMLAVAGRRGFAFCAYCGNVHVPARPNDPRASFCEACRADKVPQRLATQRYGAKKRAESAT
jgi:hypothetical protein